VLARVRAQQARADKQADRRGVGPEARASGPTLSHVLTCGHMDWL